MSEKPSEAVIDLIDKWETFQIKVRKIGLFLNLFSILLIFLLGTYYLFP